MTSKFNRSRASIRVAAAAAAAATAATLCARAAVAQMVYESGAMGSSYQTSGATLDDFNQVGVRFQVTDFATVDRIGAHLGVVANPSDKLWGELVQLTGPTDFPDAIGAGGADVLATAVFTVPHRSVEVIESVPTTVLTPGWYALVFGGSLFGGSATGGFATQNNTQIGTPSYIAQAQPPSISNNGSNAVGSGGGGGVSSFGWSNTSATGFRFFAAQSSQYFWSDPGGNWSASTSWAPGGVPSSYDDIAFEVGGAPYAVNVNGNFAVHDMINGSDHVTLNMNGNSLTSTGQVTIGSGGTGATVDLNGGQLNLPSGHDIVLGYDSAGTFNVSDNAIVNFNPFTLVATSGIVVGQDKAGVLSVTGATINVANARVAQEDLAPAGTVSGGSGTVTLNSGGVLRAQSFTAGRNGSAVVEIDAGGQLIVTGTTKVHNLFNGTELRLWGGSLQTGSLDFSGNLARFKWTTGTLLTGNPITLTTGGPLGSGLPLTAGQLFIPQGGLTIAADATLGVNAGATIIAASLVNNGSYIQGGGSASVNSSEGLIGSGSVSIGGGVLSAGRIRQQSLTIGGNGVVSLGLENVTPAGISRVGTLDILSGKLNLWSGKLAVTSGIVGTISGSNYTGITGLIQSGRNGGHWNGDGIITGETTAATGSFTTIAVATAGQAKGIAGSTTAVWAGETVSASDVLVMYTYGGDANLDGKINVDDYGRIDFNVNLGVAGYFNGDFNYDGKINVDDYGIIDFNVGIQGAPFSAAGGVANAPALSAVPEPTAGGIILGALMLLGRRRRQLHPTGDPSKR